MSKMDLEHRTDCGIEDRKRKLQDKFEANNNIKSLVKLLGQQAVIDEVFRNNKIWFASEHKEHKWTELAKELKSSGVSLSESEMKEEFELLESENNPFFSISDSKCDIKSLARGYIQARRHWTDKIFKKFNR
jgi:hypothetical protein